MLFPKDEKLEKIEKRLDKLEKNVERKFSHIEESFRIFRDVIIKLQTEKEGLEKDRDFLIEKQKDAIRKLPVKDSFHKRITEPVKNEIEENICLIRKLSKEGIER